MLIPLPSRPPVRETNARKDDSSVGLRHGKPVGEKDRQASGVPRGAEDGRLRRGGGCGHAGTVQDCNRDLRRGNPLRFVIAYRR